MNITCNNSVLSLKNINFINNFKENPINFNQGLFSEKNNDLKNLNINNEHPFLIEDDINNLDENDIPSSIEELKAIHILNENTIPLDLNQSPFFFSNSTKPIDWDKNNQKINNFYDSKHSENFIDNTYSKNQLINDLNNKSNNLIKTDDKNKYLSNNINKTKNKEKKFLNKKTKREIIFIPLKIPKNKNSDNNTSSMYILINQDKKIKYPGKKRKNNFDKRRHDKWDESNIINKIKRGFFNYIRDVIKKNSINKDIDIKKIGNNFMENLTKKRNVVLYKRKLKNILSDVDISNKYKKFDKEYNKITIDNIYNEGKETNIINILNLTFEELFIIFRKKLNFYKDRVKYKDIEEKIKGLDLLKNNNYKDIEHLEKKIRFILYKVYKKLNLGNDFAHGVNLKLSVIDQIFELIKDNDNAERLKETKIEFQKTNMEEVIKKLIRVRKKNYNKALEVREKEEKIVMSEIKDLDLILKIY